MIPCGGVILYMVPCGGVVLYMVPCGGDGVKLDICGGEVLLGMCGGGVGRRCRAIALGTLLPRSSLGDEPW